MASIGKSITIQGDLSGDEDLIIEGTVDGKVELPNNQVTIGAHATVRAELLAKSVVVIGRVTGNVHGSERVEIQATGIVEGDVTAPRLIIAEGGVINGAVQMGGKAAREGNASHPSAPGEDLRQLAG
jgi:cytoskeletal protein CcmA (bactofilin family)